MRRSDVVVHDLRRLFLGIARAAAASTCVVACAEEHNSRGSDERPADMQPPLDSSVVGHDASVVGHDAAAAGHDTQGEYDAARPRPDGGGASDAGQAVDASASDAGPKDTGVPTDGGDGAAWESVPCMNGLAQPNGTLNTATKTDYLGIHRDYNALLGAPPMPLPDGGFAVRRAYAEAARVGVSCAGVPDLSACDQLLTTLKSGGPACTTDDCRFALVGGGIQYTRIDLRDALLARLGSIDTVAEAVLLAAFDGHHVCPGLRTDPRDIGLEVRPAPGGGYELRATYEPCGVGLMQDLLTVAADGALKLVSSTKLKASSCAIGRRAPGACDSTADVGSAPTPAAAFLAQAARLEAGSIYAFYQLIRELTEHGAPEALRLAALDALLDEVVHAQDVGALARELGAEVIAPEVRTTPLRSRLALALDNAQEGCVRETFGALLATYQAETAEDARVRALMARIAEDETRHATLSWQLMAWLTPQLSEAERATVAVAQQEARAALADELDFGLSEAERRALGMPGPALWGELLGQMDRALAAC